MVFSIFFIFYIWRCFYLFLFYFLHLKVYILCGFFYWFTFKFILYHFFLHLIVCAIIVSHLKPFFFTPKGILYTWRYSLSFCYCTWGYTLSGFLTHSVFSIVFFAPEGVLNRHESDGGSTDTLRSDLAKAMSTYDDQSDCFFNKQIDIKVLSDLQIQTLGWTNIEEAIDTGILLRTKTIAAITLR